MINIKDEFQHNWITGFVDAEGCFTITITKDTKYKLGWRITSSFQVKLHVRDRILILGIKSFFNNIGRTWENKDLIYYAVNDIKDILNIIIPHFDKYPLITQKQSDFLIWKEIILLINNKEHLNSKGLNKILSLRASLNKGLSKKLKESFPTIIEATKLRTNLSNFIDPNWIAGFFSGEGSFAIRITKSNTHKTNHCIFLSVRIGQHLRDEILIKHLINFFNCGYTTIYSNKNYIQYSVGKFEDIYLKIIPFFKLHKIKGEKLLDFEDFCLAANLMNSNIHSSQEGLCQIKAIKSRMNKARYSNI